jgi:hypothetical protein
MLQELRVVHIILHTSVSVPAMVFNMLTAR